MEEQEKNVIWYYLRGPGLICLCALVFFFGSRIGRESGSIAVSGSGENSRLGEPLQKTGQTAVLTFETVYGGEQTEKILDILTAHQIRAVFFVTGQWAEQYPETVKRIVQEGHKIGSCGENGKNMSGLSPEAIKEELETSGRKLERLTGVSPTLFRPPCGTYSSILLEIAEKMGYTCIWWDVDSEDWKDYVPASITAAVVENPQLKNGSVIRLHSGTKYTAEALEGVICGLQEKGYDLTPD